MKQPKINFASFLQGLGIPMLCFAVFLWSGIAGLVQAQGPPVQTGPNPAVPQPVNALLDWNGVSGASGYDWQLYQGTNLIDSGGPITATSVRVDAGYGTTYRWRVRARVLPQNNPWSGYWTFTTVALVPPVHDSPANGATGLPLTVTMNWQGVSGATGYDWELSQGGNVVASGGPIAATQITQTLNPNTNYTWRVRARVAPQNNPWSSPWGFKTAPLVPPAHNSPADGATQLPRTVTLDWQGVSGATGYDWEIYQGGNLVAENGPIAATSVTQTLNPNTLYSWRVRARVATQNNPWSNPWTFRTAPLIPPVHVSPPNGANLTPLTVTLDWQAVAGASLYDWEISHGGSVVAGGLIAATRITQTLNGGRTYSWRVRARVVEQNNPWSEPWQFRNGMPIQGVSASPPPGEPDRPVTLKLLVLNPEEPEKPRILVEITTPLPSGYTIRPNPEPGVIGYRLSKFGTLIAGSADYTFNGTNGELKVFKPGVYQIAITPILVPKSDDPSLPADHPDRLPRDADPVEFEFTIIKVLPQLSWPGIVDVVYGQPLWTPQQAPQANVAGTFRFETSPDTRLDVGGYDLVAVFTPSDQERLEDRSISVPINVLPAPLTVSAGQHVRRQGSNLSRLPVSYSGFRHGDGPADLDSEPMVKPPASALPGNHVLQVEGGADPNYTLTRVNGQLTILPLPATSPLVMEPLTGASPSWLISWEEWEGWRLMESNDCRRWTPVDGVYPEGSMRRFRVNPPSPGGATSRFFSLQPIP